MSLLHSNCPIPSDLQVLQLAYATGYYVHRSYDEATLTFGLMVDSNAAPEAIAPIYLMRGNSLLFTGNYTDAMDAFVQTTDAQPNWAEAYHNLGVAQMNQAWEKCAFQDALKSFTTTLELSPDFALSHVARGLLGTWDAIVNAGKPVDTLPMFERSQESCRQALDAADPRIAAQAAVCLANAQIAAFSMYPDEMQLDLESMQLEGLARPHWALPLVTQGAAHYMLWKSTDDPAAKTIAETELVAGLAAARDDVHLEHSKQVYDTSFTCLQKLWAH